MFGLVPFNRREANLFSFMDDMEKSVFNSTINGKSQFRCDIKEQDGSYLMEAELPGFNKDEINIKLDGDTLTISASHKEEKEEKDEKTGYIRRERRYGSFSRSFDISEIDADHIKADYKNGILTLELPKLKEVQPPTRHIEIGE